MASKKSNNWNNPLLMAGLAIYGALLLLFGWQTWQFVNWLFPDDQLLAKLLTMLSFDVLAAFWAIVHTFYRFKSRGAKHWVQIAWGLTFVLSFVASILYLVIQFFFRFRLAVDTTMINLGYAVSILALVFNILSLMSWLILEYRVRNPRQDEFEDEELVPQGQTYVQPQHPLPIGPSGKPYMSGNELFTAMNKHPQARSWAEWLEMEKATQSGPLASAPTSQNGANQNGNK